MTVSTIAPDKRKTRAGRRRKPALRASPHESSQTRKGRSPASWVRPISIYAFLNSAGAQADSAVESNRFPSPLTRGGRWS
jgi:hypothetical protein